MASLIAVALLAGPVHIESPRPVELVRRVTVWTPPLGRSALPRYEDTTVCTSPCDRAVEGGAFFIAGEHVVPSEVFAPRATVVVRPGDTRVQTAGMVVTLGAVVAAIAGLVSLGLDLHAPGANVRPFTVAALISYGGLMALGGALLSLSETRISFR